MKGQSKELRELCARPKKNETSQNRLKFSIVTSRVYLFQRNHLAIILAAGVILVLTLGTFIAVTRRYSENQVSLRILALARYTTEISQW